MELKAAKVSNLPSFKRLLWHDSHREETQFAIAEIMRFDKNSNGTISYQNLRDTFEKIDELDDDVIVNCSCRGGEEVNGIFSMIASTKRGTTLADVMVHLGYSAKDECNEKISSFYDTIVKKLDEIKNARHMTQEQIGYYEQAKSYMTSFDKRI